MSPPASDRHLLAVPVLGERGGGIGQVSALLWDAMRDAWPDRVDIVTLLRNGHTRPHAVDKVRFGVRMAGHQLIERPRVVVFSHLGLARFATYVPTALQSPYAIFLHGIESWKPLGARQREVLRGASLRIANSRFTAQRAEAANPGLGDIEICPLSLGKGAAIPRSSRLRGSSRTVLAVGRLAATERYKGHEQLLRAWPTVVARMPEARLVIAGDGDDAPRLRKLAAETGAGTSIRFAGFLTREQLDAEYSNAALFALPSRGEGFGLVYLEAMAHGLPCIASVRDAASEVIADGETGVLVDPESVPELSEAVVHLLQSSDRRAALGEAGRVRVSQHFTYDRFRDRLTGLLDDALQSSASGS